MNELNEILAKVVLLSPAELSILLDTTKCLTARAADTGLCIDSDFIKNDDDGLLIDEK